MRFFATILKEYTERGIIMSKKDSKSKQKRIEQEKLARQKQEQKQNLIKYSIIAAVAVLVVVTTVILIAALTRPSNYVCLTVSYTDDAGVSHTGDIIIELDPDQAPITVKNFQKLVKQGFYDGLTFHRVIEGFMIQGGDPDGNGTGGSKNNIKGEFSKNGVNNTILHERGVISMARSGERRNSSGQIIDYGYNSASSQFFIVHQTSPHLDGSYAAFGRVLSGMEYVDGIAAMTTNSSNNKPLKDAIIVSAKLISKP